MLGLKQFEIILILLSALFGESGRDEELVELIRLISHVQITSMLWLDQFFLVHLAILFLSERLEVLQLKLELLHLNLQAKESLYVLVEARIHHKELLDQLEIHVISWLNTEEAKPAEVIIHVMSRFLNLKLNMFDAAFVAGICLLEHRSLRIDQLS